MNQELSHFPESLHSIASSLAIEKGEKVDRAKLIQVILLKIEKLYKEYLQHGFKVVKLLWESYATSIGKHIVARTLTGSIEGKALGINEEGVLLIEDADGMIHHIYSADIEFPENKM